MDTGGVATWDTNGDTAGLLYLFISGFLSSIKFLDKDAPVPRPVQRTGVIRSRAILGGLHHHYARAKFSVHTAGTALGISSGSRGAAAARC